MLVVANLAGDRGCLALQPQQEAVQGLGLAWERSQQPHQAGLLRELPQEVDDDLVHCGLLT